MAKKGEITLRILEAIADTVCGVGDLVTAILGAGYGASYNKIQYELNRKQQKRINFQDSEARKKQLRHRYSAMLSQLKRDGLIKEIRQENKKSFSLTLRGREKIKSLRERIKKQLPSPLQYKKINTNRFVIVIFDIPERERRKRDWLRAVLTHLELNRIQKSVWIGKARIPSELLEDLAERKLVDYVEIFEITKQGTLSHLL